MLDKPGVSSGDPSSTSTKAKPSTTSAAENSGATAAAARPAPPWMVRSAGVIAVGLLELALVWAFLAVILRNTPSGMSRILQSANTFLFDEPFFALALITALVTMACTPLAFAWLSGQEFFHARRGRTMLRPSFPSLIVGMLLVMGIPALFASVAIKSRYFEASRYEFDPNIQVSVRDKVRGFATVQDLEDAEIAERKRLVDIQNQLVEHVKSLDQKMIPLRLLATRAPESGKTLKPILEELGRIREIVKLDAPQQQYDERALPADLQRLAQSLSIDPSSPAPIIIASPGALVAPNAAPANANAAPGATAPAAPKTQYGQGLSPAEADAEIAQVPAPQQPLAKMLPLSSVPKGWVLGPLGKGHIESFNAQNLYEKIDGRAESFLDYDVQGMACCVMHPEGDETNEIQVFIFEMGSTLKALGKFGTEKPAEGIAEAKIGTEGYEQSGGVMFYAGKYYTRIESTSNTPDFTAAARTLAQQIAAAQLGTPAPAVASAPATTPAPGTSPNVKTPAAAATIPATPEGVMALLPTAPKKDRTQFVSQDALGFSFLSDVFLAEYTEGDAKWLGFLRVYSTPEVALAAFERYAKEAAEFGAVVKKEESPDTDRMFAGSGLGMHDFVFVKGNILAGVNGSNKADVAKTFMKAFAKALPKSAPCISDAKSESKIVGDGKDQDKGDAKPTAAPKEESSGEGGEGAAPAEKSEQPKKPGDAPEKPKSP